MYTVKQVSRIVGIAPTTVRNWGKELEAVLSPSANPEPGSKRRYSEDDVVIIHTAKVLKDEGTMSWDDVIETIEAGQRILPEPGSKPPTDDAPSQETGIVEAEYWDRMTKPFREHVATLEAQLDRSQRNLEEERTARLDAEIRATKAETELEVLRDIVDRETPTEEPEEAERRSFWQRIFRR